MSQNILENISNRWKSLSEDKQLGVGALALGVTLGGLAYANRSTTEFELGQPLSVCAQVLEVEEGLQKRSAALYGNVGNGNHLFVIAAGDRSRIPPVGAHICVLGNYAGPNTDLRFQELKEDARNGELDIHAHHEAPYMGSGYKVRSVMSDLSRINIQP